ncbi:Ger(x)C family spore germination protein [Clostridium sp. WILCCON 0269]|uniref:Ger(X)C family spore germination protein n=1 Tax=Candidatus Clostridium eludens TaxID=3381663 RepID=A0ABW8SLB2_9CLOT
MKKFKVFLIIIVVCIFIICFIGVKGSLIQSLEIPVGVGVDIERDSVNTSYRLPLLVYSFEDNKVTSNTFTGEGGNLGETRETRQLKEGKKTMLGLNRIFLFSANSASAGIKSYLDLWLNNPYINDRALCAVCKGKAEDMFKYKVKGYSNTAEYIEGMIKNLQEYNFFPTEYSLMDLIVREDAEGRNILLPYIEIKNAAIETTGLAVFKGDKMVGKADINETRIINILKENRTKGTLTLQNNSKEYINSYTYSKRKVKCYKENGKYKFVIDLNLKGNIISNQLYGNLNTDPKVLKKFEKDMKSYVDKMCNKTINDMKCEYKTDILDLGRTAAAKYGRGTGTDWNKAVCSSDIQVNVKFTVDTEGRGDYQ